MTVPGLLLAGRQAAEALMRSRCTITRPGTGGEATWNEPSGTYTSPTPDTVYTGRCKVQDNGRDVTDVEAGDAQPGISSLSLHLPVDGSGAVRRDDVAVIDSNPDDPSLVGRRLIVRGTHHATLKTARRLPVEEVV